MQEKNLMIKSNLEENKKKYDATKYEGEETQPAPENDEHLDEHGRVKYDERINMKCSQKEAIFIHQCIRDIMSKGLVPLEESGPCMTLLEIIAECEPEIARDEILVLPVNYFVGMWHCLNTARKFSIYSQQWKKKDKKLDHLTMRVASYIDKYHKVKEHETGAMAIEAAPKPDYFKNAGKASKGKIKYIENK